METTENARKLNRIAYLLFAILIVLAILGLSLIVGLLPKLERLVKTTESVERRFQSFADDIQPVLSAGAGKAVESIKKIDADRLSRTATERSDELIEAAAEKAKRFLDRDRKNESK